MRVHENTIAMTYLAHWANYQFTQASDVLTSPYLGSEKSITNDGKVRIVIQFEVLN